MKKVAECAHEKLAPELPFSGIRGMCRGISADVPNDVEQIQNTQDAESIIDRSGSRTAPSTR